MCAYKDERKIPCHLVCSFLSFLMLSIQYLVGYSISMASGDELCWKRRGKWFLIIVFLDSNILLFFCFVVSFYFLLPYLFFFLSGFVLLQFFSSLRCQSKINILTGTNRITATSTMHIQDWLTWNFTCELINPIR